MVLQVYADVDRQSNSSASTPLFFFIDEPETFLHPQAQDKLLNSLEKISENSQVFITTHSPYLLRNYKKDSHKLYIFSRNSDEERIREDIQIGILPYSPSWGEINYFAFKVASQEFHNELFGELHNRAVSKNKTYDNNSKFVGKRIASFDDWECMEIADITSISQPCYKLGRYCVERLLQRIKQPSMEHDIYEIPCKMIFRSSL